MAETVIRVESLSKRYHLNHRQAGDGLRHVLQDRLAAPWRALRASLSGKSQVEGAGNLNSGLNSSTSTRANSAQEEFWALKDVSFEVKRGEVVGIIGRNGAGKSTLLKILSRITEPTSGQVEIDGRVASLLEVGTGFHPELTGRENIYLNGAILGMKRSEIRRKFDEIVAFAEVEKFLDTPVKRYSSGMYVRLAFAVAAHLEPEILIVDEVLAVGDSQFQKKCLGKIDQVARNDGRTVLLVSHNMSVVSSLASEVILLADGAVRASGPTEAVISRYLAMERSAPGGWTAPGANRNALQILQVRLIGLDDVEAYEFEAGEGFTIELEYVVREPTRDVLVEVWIMASDGSLLVAMGDQDTSPNGEIPSREPGRYRARISVPGNWLNIGSYVAKINSGTSHATYDHAEVCQFRMQEARRLTARHNRRGYLVPLLPWSVSSMQ